MDFRPTEAQALIRDAASDFAARVIAPRARAIDEEESFPADIVASLAGPGLLAMTTSADLGGAGVGTVAYALAIESLAHACASIAVMTAVTNMVCETIARFGTAEQRGRHCRAIASGEYGLASFALSEPDAGSDPGAMRTSARREGAEWILDGAKQWITGGGHAGVLVVWARTDAPETAHRGISCFLVERGTPGLTAGKPEDKMGIRGSNTVPLRFDGCRVPEGALLGPLHGGFKIAMSALDGGRIGIAAQALGIARAALEESVAYAKERRAFGAPIGHHQGLAWKLADMKSQLDAAHLLTMRAAWRKERGQPFSREASMCKLFASEAAIRIANDAVQIHGGYGYIRDFPAERHLRDARVTTLYEGTSEIQRTVIARAVLDPR